MNVQRLNELDAGIQQLNLVEQVWLMERLAHYIHDKAALQQSIIDKNLREMADDPDIQREIHQIDIEFAVTELDGLGDL